MSAVDHGIVGAMDVLGVVYVCNVRMHLSPVMVPIFVQGSKFKQFECRFPFLFEV